MHSLSVSVAVHLYKNLLAQTRSKTFVGVFFGRTYVRKISGMRNFSMEMWNFQFFYNIWFNKTIHKDENSNDNCWMTEITFICGKMMSMVEMKMEKSTLCWGCDKVVSKHGLKWLFPRSTSLQNWSHMYLGHPSKNWIFCYCIGDWSVLNNW